VNHKAGDTVRIQSREWINDRNKDSDGDTAPAYGYMRYFQKSMYRYAGRTAKVIAVNTMDYNLDVDAGTHWWEDWMFDPGYRPDEPQTPEDAIRAMLDGETLYSQTGVSYFYSSENRWFYENGQKMDRINDVIIFASLYHRPEKRKRLMTAEEIKAWAFSEESRGWMVRCIEEADWRFPMSFGYSFFPADYQRARMLPDLSGVDPATAQRFEVEE
jgi:hypothetical protein